MVTENIWIENSKYLEGEQDHSMTEYQTNPPQICRYDHRNNFAFALSRELSEEWTEVNSHPSNNDTVRQGTGHNLLYIFFFISAFLQ